MSSFWQPRKAIVLGTSMSGKIAALVLSDRMDVSAVVGPRPVLNGSTPAELTGKQAHSHAFLPRFLQDIDSIAPALGTALDKGGLKRVPASRLLRHPVPLKGLRLKAMRWQVDDVLTGLFNERCANRLVTGGVDRAHFDRWMTSLDLDDGRSLPVDADTLVVDAMGANSPLMNLLSALPEAPPVENLPSSIGYVTQVFRLRKGYRSVFLPDPVADCARHLGLAFVTLYSGAQGWFSVTLAWDIRNAQTRRLLSDTKGVAEIAARSPGVARWIDAAQPVGRPRQYINPRNRWSVPILASEVCPQNYVAIGDALTTTAPTLGAGCSWLTSHIRILTEALEDGGDWRSRFVQKVEDEQRAFFDLSVATGAPQAVDPPPEMPPLPAGVFRMWLASLRDSKRAAEIRESVFRSSTLRPSNTVAP